MRVVILIAIMLAGVAGAVWIVVARLRQANTPTLDAVAGLLGPGAARGNGVVTGTVDGRRVEYRNKQYRGTMWTELTVAAPGAKVALELRARRSADPPGLAVGLDGYTVEGAPEGEVQALLGPELRAAITALHPQSIKLETSVAIVADRTIASDADARALVQLGLDLAARAAGAASSPLREQQRQEFVAEQADRSRARVIGGIVVLVAIGAGIGALALRSLRKRR